MRLPEGDPRRPRFCRERAAAAAFLRQGRRLEGGSVEHSDVPIFVSSHKGFLFRRVCIPARASWFRVALVALSVGVS